MEPENWLPRNGHFQIEVVVNLGKMLASGAVIVTRPKVENGFGFPARAFAVLPSRRRARR